MFRASGGARMGGLIANDSSRDERSAGWTTTQALKFLVEWANIHTPAELSRGTWVLLVERIGDYIRARPDGPMEEKLRAAEEDRQALAGIFSDVRELVSAVAER